jgi:Protein of unknown function (DUF2975)
MIAIPIGTWLRWLRATSTFVLIAALCLAVAVLVIAFIPGSPVTQLLPGSALTGLEQVGGVTTGVAVDRAGSIPFTIHDASLAQRLLALLPVLPGLLLVAEIARRMANLLRVAQSSDPFTARTARALMTVGKLTAVAGVAVWAVSQVGQALLAHTMLIASVTFRPNETPLAWLAVGGLLAAVAQIIDRGVAMRAELDSVI